MCTLCKGEITPFLTFSTIGHKCRQELIYAKFSKVSTRLNQLLIHTQLYSYARMLASGAKLLAEEVLA